MSAAIVLAVPSKGRLQADATAMLARAGLTLVQAGKGRSYRGALGGIAGVEVAYLSAPEIAREVGAGAVHLGITGRDQIEETVPGFAEKTALLLPLGFGRCEIVVAVPEAWVDVVTMEDLDDVAGEFRPRHGRRLAVATKYVALTRRFFAGHGIADYRIVESLGATEGAPASGAADLIVDLTSTGATLRDNGLKILADGVILRSEAHLVASRMAAWTPRQKDVVAALLDRLDKGAARRAMKLLGGSE